MRFSFLEGPETLAKVSCQNPRFRDENACVNFMLIKSIERERYKLENKIKFLIINFRKCNKNRKINKEGKFAYLRKYNESSVEMPMKR